MQEDNSHSNPPPQKRTKSSELFKKQHGFSPERLLPALNPPLQQHALTRERRNKSDSEKRDKDRERDRSAEYKESLLGQALEGGPNLIVPPQVRNCFNIAFILFLLAPNNWYIWVFFFSSFVIIFIKLTYKMHYCYFSCQTHFIFIHHLPIESTRSIMIWHLCRRKVPARIQMIVMMALPIGTMMTQWIR